MLMADERVDNITGDDQSEVITDEEHVVPANSPFEFLLAEVPKQESPSTVSAWIADALAAAVDAVQTTVTVGNGAWFADGDTVLVESEQMTVSGSPAGNILTVVRGANGTTAAAHAIALDVKLLNSLAEVNTDTPAPGEFRVNYSKGWVLVNIAESSKRVLVSYTGTGSLVTVLRQIHVLPDGADFPERPEAGMVVARGGMVFWYSGRAWAPMALVPELDTTVNNFGGLGGRGLANLTWGDLVTKTIYVPQAGATVGAIGRTVAQNNSAGAESFQLRIDIDGDTGASGDAVSTPAGGYRRAAAVHEVAGVTGGRMVTVKIQCYANVTDNWEHQRSELSVWTTPWEGA